MIREYVRWCGGDTALEQEIGASGDLDHLTMPDDWYVTGGRELDLVLSYLPPVADLDGWLDFIDRALDRYGHLVRYLQVTLEANFPIPRIDGSSPGVLAALTHGLPHARAHVRDNVQVGFSLAEPAEWLGGDDDFWKDLTSVPHAAFAAQVDYVGLGLYPDGFSPHDDVHGATLHALDHLRRRLAEAHFPAGLPIHIAEAGSPSGAHRTPAGQVCFPDRPDRRIRRRGRDAVRALRALRRRLRLPTPRSAPSASAPVTTARSRPTRPTDPASGENRGPAAASAAERSATRRSTFTSVRTSAYRSGTSTAASAALRIRTRRYSVSGLPTRATIGASSSE